ncbi:MAG: hypothetical protein J1F64_10510, partial [Oscillospiraceae bacterium]|nr:hypothetical protein [Oscillospiraceae bacterium]
SDPDDMAEAFMKKKNMSQSEFIQKYKDADLEEVTKDIFETFSDEIDAYMIKSIDNMFSNMQTTSETIEVLLAKQKDNTWKIVGYSDSMPGE